MTQQTPGALVPTWHSSLISIGSDDKDAQPSALDEGGLIVWDVDLAIFLPPVLSFLSMFFLHT